MLFSGIACLFAAVSLFVSMTVSLPFLENQSDYANFYQFLVATGLVGLGIDMLVSTYMRD